MKTQHKKTIATKKVIAKTHTNSANTWSWSIYIYWFIILFFIAATFYILGRSHEIFHPTLQSVVITEESLEQSTSYIDSAKTKIASGDMAGAITDLESAIDVDKNTNAYALRGEIYMQMGEYQKAMEDFDSAIEQDSLNAVAFYDKALLDTRMENYESALNNINNALAAHAQKPSDILSMRNLYAKRGQLNLWLKNWNGAIADYTNSLARADGTVSANVYAERAEAYTAIGDYTSAINDYTAAVRVVSELIQGASSAESSEEQASMAMSCYEKSAALNLKVGNIEAAKTDLQSAFVIATNLADEESVSRIQGLINDLEK
ncbi:MAG: tetratricopeptide repeat protein [Alphaproteobacteria bacterium]|nr:tetratricopeptide repeat protein [Alphaproteobacteria bacterium]